MSKWVIILGAGASAEANAPLMSNFLDEARTLLDRGYLRGQNEDAKQFELVFSGIHRLRGIHGRANLPMVNIEDVFSAFETAELLGILPEPSGNMDGNRSLASAMRTLIERTLTLTIELPIDKQTGAPRPTGGYAGLATILQTIESYGGLTLKDVTLVTFNYDLCLDYALTHKALAVDYCLEESSEEASPKVRTLKLHGSLGWGECPECKQVTTGPFRPFFLQNNRSVETKRLDSRGLLGSLKHCDCTSRLDPLVVPPTWNKGHFHQKIAPVWRAAAAELQTAENILICGYSLPDSDHFFRYLYALGTMSDSWLRRVWVLNPDPSAESRFRNLLGPLAVNRFKFFEEGFNKLTKHFSTAVKEGG